MVDLEVIGHRGAPEYVEENTLESFELAIQLGVDTIELDVHKIATGEVVVIHDEMVDTTTDGTGPVAEYTFDDLRKLDAGKGQVVPLLEEVIDLVDKRVPINVEIKGQGTALPVVAILRCYIEKGWAPELFRVSSVDTEELEIFQHELPDVQTGVVYQDIPEDVVQDALDHHVDFISINSMHVTEEGVRKAHRQKLGFYVFTVNTPEQAQWLRELGVDGVFSNCPDYVRADVGHAALYDASEQAPPMPAVELPLAA